MMLLEIDSAERIKKMIEKGKVDWLAVQMALRFSSKNESDVDDVN